MDKGKKHWKADGPSFDETGCVVTLLSMCWVIEKTSRAVARKADMSGEDLSNLLVIRIHIQRSDKVLSRRGQFVAESDVVKEEEVAR